MEDEEGGAEINERERVSEPRQLNENDPSMSINYYRVQYERASSSLKAILSPFSGCKLLFRKAEKSSPSFVYANQPLIPTQAECLIEYSASKKSPAESGAILKSNSADRVHLELDKHGRLQPEECEF